MPTFDEKTTAVIARFLSRRHNKLDIGIYQNGKTFLCSYSAGAPDPVDSGSVFDVGSISKVFTSLLVLKTAEEEKLSLDAGVDAYLDLPEGRYPTIRALLAHRCGYGHFTPFEITVPALFTRRYSVKNIYEKVRNEDVLRLLAKRRTKKETASFGYSDFSYAVLALVLERVCGRPFADLMNDFLRRDLGLPATRVIAPDDKRETCYLGNRAIKNWCWPAGNPYAAAGGVSSTAADIVSFLKTVIENDPARPYVTQSFAVETTEEGHNLTYFLGKKKTHYWHVGGTGQFRDSMMLNPKKKIGVIVLGNAKGKKSGNVHYLCKMIYHAMRRNKLHI